MISSLFIIIYMINTRNAKYRVFILKYLNQ